MTQMKLSEFIIRKVKGSKPCRFKIGCDLMGLAAISDLNSHINMGGTGISDSLVKLCHIAIADTGTEPFKAAALLWNRDGKNSLTLLTDFSPLADKAQPIKIHISPASNRHQGLVLAGLLADPRFHAGNC